MNDSQKTRKQLIEEMANIRRESATVASSKNKLQKNAPESTESDNIFYKAFLSSPDMFIIANPANGTYIEVNDSFVKNTGYSRKELIGRSVVDFNMWVHQDEFEKMNRLLAEHGKLTDEEFSFRMKSGEIRQWLCSAEIVNMNGTDRMIAVATDVTERKQEDERHQTILRTTLDGVWTVDLKGKFVEVNDSYCKMIGYTREELQDMSIMDIEAIDTPEDIHQHIDKIVKKGGDRFETRHKRKDGQIIDVEISVNYLDIGEGQMAVFVRDITERKRAEEAIKESEDKFSKAFRTIPHTFAIARLKDSRLIEVNDTYCRVFGYTRDDLVGHSELDLGIWVDPKECSRLMGMLIKNGNLYNEECDLRNKSGEIIKFLLSAEIIDISNERCYVSIATDITIRKQAEEALKESEERFRTLFETMAQGVVYQNAEGKIISANPAAERILGLTLEQMQGRTSVDPRWKAIHEDGSDFPGEQHPAMVSLRKGKPVSGVVMGVYHPVDDEYKWIIISAVPEFRKGEDTPYRVYTSFSDITGRRLSQEALRQSEERFSKAFHSSPDMITLINLETGKYVEVNESFINTTGYTREELVGHSRNEVNIWANQEDETKMGRLMAESGKIIDQIFHIRTKSGNILTWQCSADVINIGGDRCLLGVAADITERIRAEEALRESEAELQSILRAAPIGIALIQDSVALWVNDYMSTLTGYSSEEMVGSNARKLCVSDEDFLRVSELKAQNIELYGKSEIESKLVCKNGKIIDILIISTPLDSEDPSAGEIAMMMDITERKKAEEQEREAKNLRELDKLRTELLANVSHELRTPLASIKGFTTVLTDYDKKLTTEEKREYLEIIDHNTDRLSELIEQLLVMSRLGAGMLTIDRSPSDINKLCQEVISEAKIRSPEYQFKLHIPTRLPRVNIDTKRIRQVLDNLIDNAVKHSSAGTEISIAARKSNSEIIVTVTDAGTGISRKDKPRVFDRMYHADRNHKRGESGAGLGLSICKGVIEAHQGKIWIESEEGKGTRCFFTLPTYNNRGIRNGKKDKGQYHSVRRG